MEISKEDYEDLKDCCSCVVCCNPEADDDGYCSEMCRFQGVSDMFEWLETNGEGKPRASLWNYMMSPILNKDK